MGIAGSIGDQLDTLETKGTEAFDADAEQLGNALLDTGHPEDPMEDPNRSPDGVRDPTAAARYYVSGGGGAGRALAFVAAAVASVVAVVSVVGGD